MRKKARKTGRTQETIAESDTPPEAPAQRVFLLSPANSAGERMALVLSPRARFALAHSVQGQGAPIGEVFAFASGLYFRGKLAYARCFARPPEGVPGALVIAPGAGLVPPDVAVRADDLRAFGAVPVDAADPRFRLPLERDARLLADRLGPRADVVLLGSIASPKYVEPLLAILGSRLVFPLDFVGRGDMSRGGLMLRAVRAGVELGYGPVEGAVRRGTRPPRLPPLPRAPGGSGDGGFRSG
ncbi:hypothetical protein [Anaeromyxobacter sp. Fw109-5]|uniref:hypothetical protein n=1 Tax=Anaeromyxobacter sp. (strain Fw109-5) TaxID=404589 RepID=UPI0003213791|nr:hypothetical protein [Anaeromyxobacter sp. Fw109-5]